MAVTVFLKAGTTSWVVPDGVTSLAKVELLGCGGSGAPRLTVNGGGGGGAYCRAEDVAVSPGQVITCQVPAGGADQPTWFISSSTISADYGRNGVNASGGIGGSAANCIGGAVAYSGGLGSYNLSGRTVGGGGGAAGPHGNGGDSGQPPVSDRGCGGGGANGGGNGLVGTVFDGGERGGHNRFGTGGGAGGVANSSPAAQNGVDGGGGGGGGGTASSGGDGSIDPIWVQTSDGEIAGPGSGGGGLNGRRPNGTGGNGGIYGGGGGGVAGGSVATPGAGGAGLIVITYEEGGSEPTGATVSVLIV